MRYESAIDIAAPPEKVWEVVSDVRNWPRWTPTVTDVTMLDDRPFGVGSRARIRQPKIAPAVWQVTRYEPGRSFAWFTRNPGITSVGDHVVTPIPGGARVVNSVDQYGPLERLLRPFVSGLVRRYVQTEVESLKRYCETPQDSDAPERLRHRES